MSKERDGALYQRLLPGGFEIVVYRMAFNFRVCFGEQGDSGMIDAYCYPDHSSCMAAAEVWNGEGGPPVGWVKHVMSGRWRPNGDPALEVDPRDPESVARHLARTALGARDGHA